MGMDVFEREGWEGLHCCLAILISEMSFLRNKCTNYKM